MNTVEITCYVPGCGYSPFPMEQGYRDRCRRTHEIFLCPAGHQQYFAELTSEEKEIVRLKGVVRSWEKTVDACRVRADELKAEIDDWRARAEHPWCPWPGCDFQGNGMTGLRSHMRARHGMPTLAMIEREVEVA